MIVDSGMTVLKVVSMYIASDGLPCFTDVGILRKVGFLIFEAAEPSFNHDVVCPVAFSIHALTDMVFFEKRHVLGTCKLASLIRVQDQRLCHFESFLQRVYNHSGVQGIIDLPDNNTTVFFVKHFSLKKASEFPVFSKGFSLL